MPLVDYESESDEESQATVSTPNSPEQVSVEETAVVSDKPLIRAEKRAGSPFHITPAGRQFKGEKTETDLSVLLALRRAGANPASSQPLEAPPAAKSAESLKAKRSLDLPAPAAKRLDLAPKVTEKVTEKVPENLTEEDGNAAEPKGPAGFNALEFYNQSLSEQQLQDDAPVHAVGGGRHQLSSLVRNAQDNKAALEQSFSQSRQTRKSARQKYGF